MKKIIWSLLCLVVIIAGGFWWYAQQGLPEIPLGQPFHAHALLDISICGEHKDLPKTGDPRHHLGLSLLHTHDDNVIHVEGVVQGYDKVSLGAFFDNINVSFDNHKIFNVTNGDLCNGIPGALKMYVNGKPNTEFRAYVVKATPNPQDQIISLVFE